MDIFDGTLGKEEGKLLKGDLVTKPLEPFRESNNDFKRSEDADNLKSIKDTYMRINWADFKELIESKGFKQGLSYEMCCTRFNYMVRKIHLEEAAIFYNTENGLIIWAESYNDKKTLKCGRLFGMVDNSKPSKESDKKILKALKDCYYDSKEECYYELNLICEGKNWFSYDITEGLISKINQLEKNTKLLAKWGKSTNFLRFVDCIEKEDEDYDYKKINESKIRRLPQEAQDIISLPQEESKNIIDVEFTEVGK